jgi:hypothetical protein
VVEDEQPLGVAAGGPLEVGEWGHRVVRGFDAGDGVLGRDLGMVQRVARHNNPSSWAPPARVRSTRVVPGRYEWEDARAGSPAWRPIA